jgi:ParB-like chromosome segregation protein Spo0J
MSVLSPKKKNVYLERINETLLSFFRMIEKFDVNLNELGQSVHDATSHINDIERILGNNDEEEDEDEEGGNDQQKTICELNENLNNSIREIRQSW